MIGPLVGRPSVHLHVSLFWPAPFEALCSAIWKKYQVLPEEALAVEMLTKQKEGDINVGKDVSVNIIVYQQQVSSPYIASF